MKVRLIVLLTSLILTALAQGQGAETNDTRPAALQTVGTPLRSVPISVMPSSPMDMNNFVVAGTSTRSESAPFVVNLRLNCTKGSLAADFPIVTTNSTLAFHFSLKPGNGTISVRFPAQYVGKYDAFDNPMPFTTLTSISGPGSAGVRAAIAGNLVRIEIPAPQIVIDPTNPSDNIPKVAEDFYFQSSYHATQFDFLTGGPPDIWALQRTYDHLYQAPGSYSADLEVTFPAGTSDPDKAPLKALFAGSLIPRRTNVLDCRGALAP